jgi:hypothetical protein
VPPHGNISFGLVAAPPHGNISFGLAAAPPLGNIDLLFALRQRLTAILFIPPRGGASWQFFLFRLAGILFILPHGDNRFFCSAYTAISASR